MRAQPTAALTADSIIIHPKESLQSIIAEGFLFGILNLFCSREEGAQNASHCTDGHSL